ncbi:MAG: histidine--tRNA ligase [Candidatus Bathyarchaeota archaeon]|nr:histidine--tRNA ligase [Candidatus Bathyarchaeum tardum]WGM89896.1 MAG: histidine--tRNA ligase [Candidatus Bathyarchaeum tardum]
MFKTVRGMRDLLPGDAQKMRYVEQVTRYVSKLYGYEEIITPVLESYELLAAKTSEEIRERMYKFEDLGGRQVAMRPEFTASVARLVVNKLKNEPKPMRLFSTGSLYRYDEPQYGRFREFWQANYELFGSTRPEADAEILMLTNNVLKNLGLKNYRFKVGHTGILRGILTQEGLNEQQQNNVRQLLDKKEWNNALAVAEQAGVSKKGLAVLQSILQMAGEDPWEDLVQIRNTVQDYITAVEAVDNLQKIIELVKDSGEQLEIQVEAGFARGLEYYTGMIFESYVPDLDIAIGGGGRYDKLIELFGGEPIPAVGVAQGIDRIVLALTKQNASPEKQKQKTVVVIAVKPECMGKALEISSNLRNNGAFVEVAVMGRSIRSALSDANRRNAGYAVIVGPKELEENNVVIKDMKNEKQRTVSINSLVQEILAESE